MEECVVLASVGRRIKTLFQAGNCYHKKSLVPSLALEHHLHFLGLHIMLASKPYLNDPQKAKVVRRVPSKTKGTLNEAAGVSHWLDNGKQ